MENLQIQAFLSNLLQGWDHPAIRIAVILAISFLVALIIKFVVIRIAVFLTKNTKTSIDDELIDAIKKPIFWSVLIVGASYAFQEIEFGPQTSYIVFGVLKSVVVLMWGMVGMRLGTLILRVLSDIQDRVTFIQSQTLPLFEITLKLLVFSGIIYFTFISWDIDVTAWLASAGIVGIAVGFAAKDTLANLFAGIFILTDAPYKLGDYIVLSKGERGMVTQIGIRSTRILTRDNIEITIPNAGIGNSMIMNETSGPSPRRRLRINIGVAYGCDVDQVSEVLLGCVDGIGDIDTSQKTTVRLKSFGDSALNFQLRVYVNEPEFKGRVTDKVNRRIYKALNAANIEIPYPQQDLHIKEMPARG